MKPTITAFKDSPDRGQGHARDIRVRWAFEEAGQSYNVRLVTFQEMEGAEYRKLQPFGQIPAFQEGNLVLFETGAIILHLAENHAGLLPAEPDARARAITWMFAALNSVEPFIVEREAFILTEKERPWFKERLPILDERVRTRLKQLSLRLGSADWLDGEFSAGDLLMVSVLRRPASAKLLDAYPNLQAYISRAESRPAYQRAFAAQLKVFQDGAK